ncbi:MAG: hypothetical protein M3133_09340 [Actinomycetota bacterium]|nr:hypothetical protein [Actinomycetota bacterium]
MSWGRPRKWMALAAVAFGVNLLWELAQSPLYAGAADLPMRVYLRAGAVDALLVTGAAAVATLLGRRSRVAFWMVFVGTLLASAVFIEVRAVTGGRWSYSALMPTIGVVGISPLVQLPLTGALSMALVSRLRPCLERRGRRHGVSRASGEAREPGGSSSGRAQ